MTVVKMFKLKPRAALPAAVVWADLSALACCCPEDPQEDLQVEPPHQGVCRRKQADWAKNRAVLPDWASRLQRMRASRQAACPHKMKKLKSLEGRRKNRNMTLWGWVRMQSEALRQRRQAWTQPDSLPSPSPKRPQAPA